MDKTSKKNSILRTAENETEIVKSRTIKTCQKLSEAAEKHRFERGRERRKKLPEIGKHCQQLAKISQEIKKV